MTYWTIANIVLYTGWVVIIGITAWRIGLALYHLAHGRYFMAEDSYFYGTTEGEWSRLDRLIKCKNMPMTIVEAIVMVMLIIAVAIAWIVVVPVVALISTLILLRRRTYRREQFVNRLSGKQKTRPLFRVVSEDDWIAELEETQRGES